MPALNGQGTRPIFADADGSWWIGLDREQFWRLARQHEPRMRLTRFGAMTGSTSYGPMEAAERERQRAYVAAEWDQA